MILVKVVAQNQVITLDRVQCVVAMVKLGLSQGFFTFVQQTCPQCSGSGEEITNPCSSCGGQEKFKSSKRLSVTIPKGVDDGTRIRLAGKGEAGSRGGGNGNLYLFINVYSHELFKRSDENLF